MSRFPSISAAFRQLVTDTETSLQADTSVVFPADVPKKLYFMQGNVVEVNQQLQKLTNSKAHKGKKYPLVVLFRDIKEKPQLDDSVSFNCHFAIFNLTEATYSSDQREEKNFVPILRPIYEALIQQISYSSTFGQPDVEQLEIEKWDCFFYGSVQNNKNEFGDKVDAIDITNIALNIQSFCLTN